MSPLSWTRGVVLAGLGAVTCHAEPASRGPVTQSAGAAPSASSEPVPGVDAGASPAVASGPDAAADGGEKRKLAPAPSSTPGTIACEGKQCKLATEVCCESGPQGVAACVPKPQKDQYACEKLGEGVTERHCDEKADCPGTQSCCMTWGCSGGCPPVAVCSDVPCLHGQVEQCLPGGACSPGFRCAASAGAPRGTCVYEKAGVQCGKSRCSGDAPVCCWNAKQKKGQCARDCGEEPDEDRWALSCTTPDDCGGYPCANAAVTPLQFAACMGAYDVPDRSSIVFCRSLEDCPTMNMLGKPRACLPNRLFPGNAKTCQFAGQ